MKLLAVMAHPDDAEIWCGGTLILHVGMGDEVRICSLAYTREAIRGREGEAGANSMGCQVEFLGMEDVGIRDTPPAVERVGRLLGAFRPDIVITHWFDDMHPDHEGAFRIVRRSVVTYFLANPNDFVQGTTRIFCCDTYNSVGIHGPFQPDRFVDVTGVWEKKLTALRFHKSQDLALFRGMAERQCAAHGSRAGVGKAEGFLYFPLFGRPDTGEPLGGAFGSASERKNGAFKSCASF